MLCILRILQFRRAAPRHCAFYAFSDCYDDAAYSLIPATLRILRILQFRRLARRHCAFSNPCDESRRCNAFSNSCATLRIRRRQRLQWILPSDTSDAAKAFSGFCALPMPSMNSALQRFQRCQRLRWILPSEASDAANAFNGFCPPTPPTLPMPLMHSARCRRLRWILRSNAVNGFCAPTLLMLPTPSGGFCAPMPSMDSATPAASDTFNGYSYGRCHRHCCLPARFHRSLTSSSSSAIFPASLVAADFPSDFSSVPAKRPKVTTHLAHNHYGNTCPNQFAV